MALVWHYGTFMYGTSYNPLGNGINILWMVITRWGSWLLDRSGLEVIGFGLTEYNP